MTTRPVTHQLSRRRRGNVAGPKPTVKRKRRLLALKLDVKMWRIMISEIHSDDDPEECRNDGHVRLLAGTDTKA